MNANTMLEAAPRLTRFVWTDNAGYARAKSVARQALPGALESGVGVTVAMQGVPMMFDAVQEESGLSAVGETRIRPALWAVIASALDGVRRGLHPGEPVLVAPSLVEHERHFELLPGNLTAALEHLAKDAVLLEALGPDLAKSFMAVRAAEALFFKDQDEDTEYRMHRFAY